ncbi:TfoX/Sxy family protein [Agromyces sp. H66]|uniref:TfoX/Sxy family protein n=1 Tax=Agromyces sp. H66 TaxID=2529859 RepID=UPI0010AAA0AE|nr:TfoX/Sxy family protein [Agromyces sp. H66]
MDDRTRGRERLDELAPDLLARPDVAWKRMFGTEGLSVRGKVFAFAAHDGSLAVKLPTERIDELGLDRMVMGGRTMREWARVPLTDDVGRWRAITDDAHAFVDSITA